MKKLTVLILFLMTFGCVKASKSMIYTPSVFLTDTTFKAYVGNYKLDPNGVIDTYTVTFEAGKLFGQANGYDKTELTKQAATHSFKSGYGSDVIFMQAAADKPFNKVKLVIQGNEVMATRE